MKRLALLLGGGGTVGIAWESGVLAGLADSCGFDARESTVIVGTSAGSAVGAEIVSGRNRPCMITAPSCPALNAA